MLVLFYTQIRFLKYIYRRVFNTISSEVAYFLLGHPV